MKATPTGLSSSGCGGRPGQLETSAKRVERPWQRHGEDTYREVGGVRPFFGETMWEVVEFNPPHARCILASLGKTNENVKRIVEASRVEGQAGSLFGSGQ